MRESFFYSFDRAGRARAGPEGKYRARAGLFFGENPGLAWLVNITAFFQSITGRLPFDESDQCRQILQYSTGNFEGYDPPTLDGPLPEVPAYLGSRRHQPTAAQSS